MKSFIRKILPRRIKSIVMWTYYFLIDMSDILLNRRDKLVPPKRLIFIGDGNFKQTGEEFFNYFIKLVKLQPHARVLDVGCGIGRMAVPLTRYLKADQGSYEGFDIVESGIQWCKNNITPEHENFKFQLAGIYNKAYNPNGKIKATEYQFPYGSDSFDFIFLTSVFTHMLPLDMQHYLSEISRVLKPGGKCLITSFLINSESLECLHRKASSLDFCYECQGFRTTDKDNPEAAIAFEEQEIRNLFESNRLRILDPIYYGSWCGRLNYLSYQDIILAVKKDK